MGFRTFLLATGLALSLLCGTARAETAPEDESVHLAITVPSTTHLPIYVAEANFRGGSNHTRAIIAGSSAWRAPVNWARTASR